MRDILKCCVSMGTEIVFKVLLGKHKKIHKHIFKKFLTAATTIIIMKKSFRNSLRKQIVLGPNFPPPVWSEMYLILHL